MEPISQITMTTDKNCSSYFSSMDLEVLLQAYSQYEHIFCCKLKMDAAAKEKSWEKMYYSTDVTVNSRLLHSL